MLCLSRKRMVVTKDRPHGPGRSVPMFIVVECEDHSAIQAPLRLSNLIFNTVGEVKKLPMTGFEPRICDVGSNHSTNWAITTAHKYEFFWSCLCRSGSRYRRTNAWDHEFGFRIFGKFHRGSLSVPTGIISRSFGKIYFSDLHNCAQSIFTKWTNLGLFFGLF